MISEHITRVREGVSNKYTMGNLSEWLCLNTKHEGRLLSYMGREYQPTIIDDPAKTLLVKKCAQTGLSEIFARWSLASVVTQDNFTTMYTFPAATDAELFAKARLTPIIDSSAAIQRALSRSVNSVELKQFGQNSFLYTRGTYSETGALSVPADLIIHDEYDRSDMANVAAYVSRLQMRPTKMRRLFSTPTVAGYGIDRECKTALRRKQMWTCSHCTHKFIPNYHDNVIIPGFFGDKQELTKANIDNYRWKEAKLLCPKCGQEPSNDIRYRQWVVENNDAKYETVSYDVSPFCAPTLILPSYLVKVSTDFSKWSEFCNQALGETSESAEDMITENDIQKIHTPNDMTSSDVHVMGCDLGVTCHIMIGRRHSGKLIVVHREKVHYTEFEERRRVLCGQYRVVTSVHDLFPYTDIITRITSFDPNAFGAVYVTKKSTESHYVKEQAEVAEEGKLNVRSAMINRDVALDELMYEIKNGLVVIHDVDKELTTHLLDMKRIEKFDKSGGMRYVWEKTDGVDHYHHTLLYLFIADKLRGTVAGWTAAGAVPFVTAFAVRQQSIG